MIRKLDSLLDVSADIIAMVGTALALMGERSMSKDIDLCYLNCDPKLISDTIMSSARDLNINENDVEIFHGFEMSLLDIIDFKDNSVEYKLDNLIHIRLKIMNPIDIAVSKIFRSEAKDYQDIKQLLDHKLFNLFDLDERLFKIARYQKDFNVRKELQNNYLLFKKEYSQNYG